MCGEGTWASTLQHLIVACACQLVGKFHTRHVLTHKIVRGLVRITTLHLDAQLEALAEPACQKMSFISLRYLVSFPMLTLL